ncbi:hypothetical protein [Acinetobacter baumannii]|uniref:hypothetical protein n=1 Tax=Acinetobacter baumannii TaxID=470 RepID=UPI0022B2AE42|nr:hypothetical protein [Acinetobacter baumannii]
MEEINSIALEKRQQETSADGTIGGFDFQFYYFLYCLLDLKNGEELGFEVKEDIHLDMPNGKCILSQLKHTVQVNAQNEKINLTDLDKDLWKTLGNWVELINISGNKEIFLKNHEFLLVTNKNVKLHSFPQKLNFYSGVDPLEIIVDAEKLLEKSSKESDVSKYIELFLALDRQSLLTFISKIRIESETTNIIEKIKDKIKIKCWGNSRYLDVYESLYTRVAEQKFLDISNRKKFIISFNDFYEKYHSCFLIGYEKNKLPNPDRTMTFNFPEKLEKQKFIEQLIDVDLIYIEDEIKIKEYTVIMLDFINKFEYWKEKNIILPTDIKDLDEENKYFWASEFNKIYRNIVKKIRKGEDVNKLEDEIKELACEIFDEISSKSIKIGNYDELNRKLSNGYFYSLSDQLEIGWHYSWKERYKK